MEQVKVRHLSGAKSPKRPPPPPLAARVRVAVRVRPPANSEGDKITSLCVTTADPVAGVSTNDNLLQFQLEKTQKSFRFDHVFAAKTSQSDVYNTSLQPLLASFLHGFNVTVLAYGQTGSGKTYTMGGTGNNGDDGLIPRFLREIFRALRKEANLKTTAHISFLEIYCDEIRDLLVDELANNNAKRTIHEDNHDVWVENLQKISLKHVDEALNLLKTGRERQTIGAHALNDFSSRSHVVFTLEIARMIGNEIQRAKLTFVDLAGSERVKKTLMEGQGMKEGSHINIGLLALGNVINALGSRRQNSTPGSTSGVKSTITNASGSTHVPYRSSKLTRLLRDALGGNSVTLFIACVSPEITNSNETLCTLQYANRARSIQNQAQKNVQEAKSSVFVDDTLGLQQNTESEREMNDLRDQIAALRLQLAEATAKTVKVCDLSSVGVRNGTNSSGLTTYKSRKRLQITPLELHIPDFKDNNHRLESPGVGKRKKQQKDNFFICSSPLATNQLERCNSVETQTKMTFSPKNRSQNGNQSPNFQLPSRNLKYLLNQSTQYESPVCLGNKGKTPVDYVLLPPSQIYREVHHQRQKTMKNGLSKPHQRRFHILQRERTISPSLRINTNNTINAKPSQPLDLFQDIYQRTQQLIENNSELLESVSKPEIKEENHEQQTSMSLNQFVDRMTALFNQQSRQQEIVSRLKQRVGHFNTLLGTNPEKVEFQRQELAKLTLKHQQITLQQELKAFELLAAKRLWNRLIHREKALDNDAKVWNEKLETVFLTENQYEACKSWHSERENHEFFRQNILPYLLNAFISITSEDLENEQLWLVL